MSPNPSNTAFQGSKNKKNKKKRAAASKTEAEATITLNGSGHGPGEATNNEDEPEDPTTSSLEPANGTSPAETKKPEHSKIDRNGIGDDDDDEPEEAMSKDGDSATVNADVQSITEQAASTSIADERFEALVRDRDSLRAEVTELRKSLEEIQSKHQEDLASVEEQLEDAKGEKEHAESQYRNLLGKVNTIKSQLGERLKSDAEDLAQTRARIEELEDQNSSLQAENEEKTAELARAVQQNEAQSQELSTLRSRTTLSQQNWVKEREELIEQEAYARAEFEEAKQAMHDWEVLAMEERSIREGLGDKVVDLEEQLSSLRDAYERAASERDSNSLTVDGLQRALQEIQTARKQELREMVENSQAQSEELREQLRKAEKEASESNAALEATKKDLERVLPFEHEVKEKNLLIGKLRHEAVILNDHLTKALRFLKKGKPEDNVDRQLVTNHFLHFLELDRSDPKKFQILQLIAALLGWTAEQREQAGLARPGGSNSSTNLRVPMSPFHRTPSTPTLTTEFMTDNSATSKESLAELWSNFLEQEAQAGSKSRTPSFSTGPKSPP